MGWDHRFDRDAHHAHARRSGDLIDHLEQFSVLDLSANCALHPLAALIEEALLNFDPSRPFDSAIQHEQFQRVISGSKNVFEGLTFPIGPYIFLAVFAERVTHLVERPLHPRNAFQLEHVALLLKLPVELVYA